MPDSDIVPLPESLRTCGCSHAPRRHALDCAAAIAFDEAPLEYAEGKRFAWIAWEYPLRIEAKLEISVELDPVAVILDRIDEYRAFRLDSGYQEWERPIQFLAELIEEQVDFGGISFGRRRLSSSHTSFDWDGEYPRWTEADTVRLEEALERRVALAVDPNQLALPVE